MSRVMSQMILAVGMLACLAVIASAQQQPGVTTTGTETKAFEVIAVDGNQLVVKLPEGTREITVPEDFRFNVDGRQMSVHELMPGMRGTATITTRTTMTPVTVTEVKDGQVVQASGGTIMVRTAEGVKSFTQSDVDKRGVKIVKDGKPASITDFHSGDRLSATIVTSRPPRTVTEKEVQATLARAEPAAPPPTPAPAPAPSAAAAAPAPPSAAAPARPAAQGLADPSASKSLPKTASPLPLFAVTGLASLLGAAVLAVRRRRLMR